MWFSIKWLLWCLKKKKTTLEESLKDMCLSNNLNFEDLSFSDKNNNPLDLTKKSMTYTGQIHATLTSMTTYQYLWSLNRIHPNSLLNIKQNNDHFHFIPLLTPSQLKDTKEHYPRFLLDNCPYKPQKWRHIQLFQKGLVFSIAQKGLLLSHFITNTPQNESQAKEKTPSSGSDVGDPANYGRLPKENGYDLCFFNDAIRVPHLFNITSVNHSQTQAQPLSQEMVLMNLLMVLSIRPSQTVQVIQVMEYQIIVKRTRAKVLKRPLMGHLHHQVQNSQKRVFLEGQIKDHTIRRT